ncbi:transcription factor UPBEAT1 [Lycium barbarum]|uniref:transcription factor UPBEAT1 n=1 Tax=Lycium barbarum TaxID=112863 RepID=UPI00293E7593|nr:transcription factor UPBEAT1 [Lycium barbarum]
MGIFSHTPNKGNCDLSDPFLGSQRSTRRQRVMTYNVVKGRHIKGKRCKSILMKRRVRVEGSRRSENEIGRKVRVLKKLIPDSDDFDLEGLFRETADYILALEMRVRVMQVMVNVLSPSNSD